MRKFRMNKLTRVLSSILVIALLIAPINALASVNSTEANTYINSLSNQVDKYIYGLSYDDQAVLTANGETISNDSFVKADGYLNLDTFIEIRREKKSLVDFTADISAVDAVNGVIYPGAILRANKNLIDNRPDPIVIDRKPITISIDLPGMGDDGKAVVEDPAHSSVEDTTNAILANWLDKYSYKYSIPTRMSFIETMAYSQQQLQSKLHFNVKNPAYQLGLDFNAISKGEKQVMMVVYKQIFYTAHFDPNSRPSDYFGDSVTAELLATKGLNSQNPPVYVSSVAYGRQIIVKMETESKSLDVKAAFHALVSGVDIKTNAEYQEIINNSTFQAIILGGGSVQHSQILTKDWSKIIEAIKNNSEFAANNPGYPVSYTTAFLKDNALATVKTTSDYLETTATEYKGGSLTLKNNGAYIAKFHVEWDELKYVKDPKTDPLSPEYNPDPDNNPNTPPPAQQYILTTERKAWEGNDIKRTMSYSTVIPLGGNVKNISITAKGMTGLAWEPWRTSVNAYNIPLVKARTVELKGTTLNQRAIITPEL